MVPVGVLSIDAGMVNMILFPESTSAWGLTSITALATFLAFPVRWAYGVLFNMLRKESLSILLGRSLPLKTKLTAEVWKPVFSVSPCSTFWTSSLLKGIDFNLPFSILYEENELESNII